MEGSQSGSFIEDRSERFCVLRMNTEFSSNTNDAEFKVVKDEIVIAKEFDLKRGKK